MAAWYHSTMVAWYNGTMVPWYHGTMAPWYHGTMVPWYQRLRRFSAQAHGFTLLKVRLCCLMISGKNNAFRAGSHFLPFSRFLGPGRCPKRSGTSFPSILRHLGSRSHIWRQSGDVNLAIWQNFQSGAIWQCAIWPIWQTSQSGQSGKASQSGKQSFSWQLRIIFVATSHHFRSNFV